MDALYTDLIIDLAKHPVNKRELAHADITGSGANVTCGDRLRIYAKLDKEGRITEATFEGQGCAISMASASLLTEEAKGKTLKEVLALNTQDIFEWLGTELGPVRVKCGLLPLETMQKAIQGMARVKTSSDSQYTAS